MTIRLNLNTKLTLIFTFLILSFFRSPYIFTEGRFMAEDGQLYFKSAFEKNFFEHLIYFPPNAGYYNLIANLLTEISTYFSLYSAPLVVAYGSLFFIILPLILILFKNSYLFNNDFQKIVACLLFFITTPNIPEIWANSINTQIYLFFSSFLILFFKYKKDFVRPFEKFLILIAGLSGIYTCILTIFFLIKYYLKKTKNNFYNFGILLICSLIQFSLILYSKINNLIHITKIDLIDKPIFYISSFIYSFFAKPIFGKELSFFVNDLFYNITGKNYFLILLPLLLIFFIFYLIRIEFFNFLKKDKIIQSLIMIYFLVLSVILVGSDNFPPSGRYATIPGLLFLIILYYVSIHFHNKYFKNFLNFLIILSLLVGTYEFRPNSKYIKFLDCINCPNWKNEIKKWETDTSYNIRIWPYNRKAFQLNKKDEIN